MKTSKSLFTVILMGCAFTLNGYSIPNKGPSFSAPPSPAAARANVAPPRQPISQQPAGTITNAGKINTPAEETSKPQPETATKQIDY